MRHMLWLGTFDSYSAADEKARELGPSFFAMEHNSFWWVAKAI